MFYEPTEEEKKLLNEAVERMYPDLIKEGIRYFTSYSKDRGTIYADVKWGRNSSLFELKNQNGKKHWYMARDWND